MARGEARMDLEVKLESSPQGHLMELVPARDVLISLQRH